ncbi:MAG: zinc ribbon domain-containing protein [Bacteroidales bacterium]|nr:zinc ribbon domain-containing protein [Bacteroidales bacterium]
MKCKHCGAEISNDSVYCEHCGKRQTKLNVFHVPLSWVLFALVFGLSWVYVLLYDLYKVYDFPFPYAFNDEWPCQTAIEWNLWLHQYFWAVYVVIMVLSVFTLFLAVKRKVAWKDCILIVVLSLFVCLLYVSSHFRLFSPLLQYIVALCFVLFSVVPYLRKTRRQR